MCSSDLTHAPASPTHASASPTHASPSPAHASPPHSPPAPPVAHAASPSPLPVAPHGDSGKKKGDDSTAKRKSKKVTPPAAVSDGIDRIVGVGRDTATNKDDKKVGTYASAYGFQGHVDPGNGDYVVRKKIRLLSYDADKATVARVQNEMEEGVRRIFNDPEHRLTVDGEIGRAHV